MTHGAPPGLCAVACGSVVSVKALGGFTAGGSIGLPSINRCSTFRIWVLVGAQPPMLGRVLNYGIRELGKA